MLKLFAITLLFYSSLFGNEAQPTDDTKLSWLAFGDLRGEIEPCGCDPKTNFGGVKRLATLMTRERSAYKNMVVLNLGNNFSLEDPSSLKNSFLEKAIEEIAPTISLLNEREFQNKLHLKNNLTYLISHATKERLQSFGANVKDIFVSGKNIFFGFVEITEFSPWNSSLEKTWRDIAKKNPGHKKYLLYSGSQKTLEKISSVSFFDEIISSNTNSDLKDLRVEKEHPESLLRNDKPPIYMTPLFGHGVLRGGLLRDSQTKSIVELMNDVHKNESTKATNQSLFKMQGSKELYTWLSPDYELGSPLSALIETYNMQLKEHYLLTLDKKRASQKNSPFVGAKACQTCHPQAFSIWENTKHAKAYETLVEKNKNFDSTCLSCHVVGLKSKEGGFISKEETPHLLGVQCENCHGARKEHAQNPTIKVGTFDTKEHMCKSCHQGTHSPNFEMAHYWNQIKHGH